MTILLGQALGTIASSMVIQSSNATTNTQSRKQLKSDRIYLCSQSIYIRNLNPLLLIKPPTISLTNKSLQVRPINVKTESIISPDRTLNIYILRYDTRTNG